MNEAEATLLRKLPAISDVLLSPGGQALGTEFGAGLLKLELRRLLDTIRLEIRKEGRTEIPTLIEMTDRLREELSRLSRPSGRRAINAAGILLHTGLGRAPLCLEATDALSALNTFTVLQASLDTGDRSLREEKVERMLIELTGCEAATVLNNNAAATMIALNTLAAGKEVILSRGQLIEIGGAFRMPDVMAQSGCLLKEIGTTNRTHLKDYENAVSDKTGAIIHVHTSNFRVRGFSGTPEIEALAPIAKKHGLPLIDDLGSGALVSLKEFGMPEEPLVAASLKAGADLVCFSGDKLICGPQSGILCGKKSVIEKVRKNPFARMFRICKMTLAALEATLIHFINDDFRTALPFYRMLSVSSDVLETRAKKLCESLSSLSHYTVEIVSDCSYIGSGSIPDEGLPTRSVRIGPKAAGKPFSADAAARRLRQGSPSVFCRIQEGSLQLDMRTLFDEDLEILPDLIRKALPE